MTIGDIGRPSSPDDWRGGAQASALETARRGSTTRAGPLSFLTECLSSNLADSLYDMPHAVRADGVQRHAIGLQHCARPRIIRRRKDFERIGFAPLHDPLQRRL